jgi:hypothetical protein
LIRNNKHTETNRENVPSVINNEIQSTCVPNEKQKEKEDITVVNDDVLMPFFVTLKNLTFLLNNQEIYF